MSNAISTVWPTSSNQSRVKCKASPKRDSQESINIKSPLLFDMLDNLSSVQQHTILDVGRASATSIDYFNDHWCKLFITDSASEIHNLESEAIDTPHKWHRALVKSMRFYKRNKAGLDVIFLWDLPNYLEPDHLKGLIHYLLPHTTDRVLLHAYLYSARQMPARPASYHINGNNTMTICPGTADQIDCPMYHQTALQKYLSPFKAKRAVMLSSGIQEYLFHLKWRWIKLISLAGL